MRENTISGCSKKKKQWLLKLLSCNFDFQYKSGKENTAADALSRLPIRKTLAIISVPFVMDFEQLEEQVAANPFLANIIRVITTNPTAYPHFSKTGTTLCYKGRVVLPAASNLIPQLLQEFHYSPMGGHGGVSPHLQPPIFRISLASRRMFKIWFLVVRYVNTTSTILLPQQDYSNPYPSLNKYERKSPWTLKDYPNHEVVTPS